MSTTVGTGVAATSWNTLWLYLDLTVLRFSLAGFCIMASSFCTMGLRSDRENPL